MRLSIVCMFKKRIPGKLYSGKVHLVKKITFKDMEIVRQDLDRQEKIMKLLRYPYLTKAESEGHSKALQKQEKRMQALIDAQQSKMKGKDVTIVDRFYHLTLGERWE